LAVANNGDWIRPLNKGSERFARVIDDGARKTQTLELISAA
jgi:hypothetical protein